MVQRNRIRNEHGNIAMDKKKSEYYKRILGKPIPFKVETLKEIDEFLHQNLKGIKSKQLALVLFSLWCKYSTKNLRNSWWYQAQWWSPIPGATERKACTVRLSEKPNLHLHWAVVAYVTILSGSQNDLWGENEPKL